MLALTLAVLGVYAFMLLALRGLCGYYHCIVTQKRAEALGYGAYPFILLFSRHTITSQISYCLHYMQDGEFNSLFQRMKAADLGSLNSTEYLVLDIGDLALKVIDALFHIFTLGVAVGLAFVFEYGQIFL